MTETQLGGNAASAIIPGRLVLLRHGQTVWSESGQHTGRTNIPLTDIGCDQARAAGERLREAFPQGFAQGCMFASPLRRAQQTAQLAGYGDFDVLPEIAEWDYGRAEVLLVAHAHVLRILTSQWLGVDPHFARLLRLDTAHYCVLSQYKGDNVIEHWNC